MKLQDFNPEFDKDKIEIVNQEQENYQLNNLGSLLLKNGMKIFEINIKEKTIEDAQYDDEVYKVFEKTTNRKIIVKENCVYITAINKKNAVRKFKQQFKF